MCFSCSTWWAGYHPFTSHVLVQNGFSLYSGTRRAGWRCGDGSCYVFFCCTHQQNLIQVHRSAGSLWSLCLAWCHPSMSWSSLSPCHLIFSESMPSQYQLSWLPLFIMTLWDRGRLRGPPGLLREGLVEFMGNESFSELSGLGRQNPPSAGQSTYWLERKHPQTCPCVWGL